MNIFIAKLSGKTTSTTLKNYFEAKGAVDSARVIMDKETGQSKRYGFIEMPNETEALAAIALLNETELDNRTIVVKRANERKEVAVPA